MLSSGLGRRSRQGLQAILGACLLAAVMLTFAQSAMASFGFESSGVTETNRDGSPDVQAGSHPYALTTSFLINPSASAGSEGALKDVRVELPPGFVGNPNATPTCKYVDFARHRCPNDTAVGYAATYIVTKEEKVYNAVYNIEPSPGVPAEFAYKVIGLVPIFLNVSVRTGGDYGLTANVRNIPEAVPIAGAEVTIWGVPGEASHDPFRGRCIAQYPNEAKEPESEGACPSTVPVLPLLSNATSCGVPRRVSIEVDTWQQPGDFTPPGGSTLPPLSGCEKLDFSPSLSVTPDGTGASTPTGLNVDLHVPQESTQNPAGLAEADVRNTTVALPAGVQISPSAADGLQACSPAQLNLHSAEASTCPDASKVGTVEIDTPLLPEPLIGAVYLAQQGNLAGNGENVFGSLLALYLVAEDKQAGVLVKVPGEVTPNPLTGQLVTTFKDTPQLPFSDLKLAFFGTARAPLSTPALCGTYTTETAIEPWTAAGTVSPSSKFQITSGPNGAPCSDPQPFAPGFQAGTTNLQAGAFTPFELTMTRPDGDQPLAAVAMKLPPGLLGTLSAVKLCPEPQAAQGTCGEDSLIGHTTVSAGLGGDPYTVTGGKVYITGPYKGAPFGLSIVNPAVAGPFNLGPGGGPIVVRATINVDPLTAALSVQSDPLPTMLQGVPLQLQHVNVSIDRPGFTFNPTNCTKTTINGTLISSEGASAPVSSSFQVTNCAQLAFKPALAASTVGRSSRANGASLSVKLTYPAGPFDANIAKVKVDLPRQLPARLTTLQKACRAAVFQANPANCPKESIVGQARATTPVLPVALTGPAYFVSHGGEAFPSLIVVLQGYGVTVNLIGTTFISKAGITSSTFKAVPDVPVGTFELALPQGKYSALAANLPASAKGSFCGVTLAMPTAFVGQNGAEIHTSTKITPSGCAKARKVKQKAKAKPRAAQQRAVQ
jgi:hypothetical protein